jgi:hypothetical protein
MSIDRLIEHQLWLIWKIWKIIKPWYFSLSKKCYISNSKILDLIAKRDLLEQLRTNKTNYISTLHRFYRHSSPQTKFGLLPKKSITVLIDSYKVDNMVGIHVRRMDNKASLENSPLGKFVELMTMEVEYDGQVQFFLATDDPATEIALAEIFPKRIVTHSKESLNRNDPRAIRDAVVDLYCLANCRKIIGSYGSSFSTTAAEINNVEKIIVGIDTLY